MWSSSRSHARNHAQVAHHLRSRIMRAAVVVLLVVGQHVAAEREIFAARRAVSVTIPLRLSLQKIEGYINEQIFSSPDGTCTLVANEKVCRFYLSRPQVSSRRKQLRITCDAVVLYGSGGGPACADPQQWRGEVELLVRPLFDAAGRLLTFQVVEVTFYDKERRRTSVPALGDAAGRLTIGRFEKVSIDCASLIDRITGLLAVMLPGGRERVDEALGSVSFGEPQVFIFSVAMKMSMPIEPLPSAPPAPAALVREKREERLKRWDAFVTFISKRLGHNRPQEQQSGVGGVLLDARYELAAAALSPESESDDPVPGLFVHTWKRLRPVALELSRKKTAASGPDLDNFITAGGVLAALSAQEKELNYQVSDECMRAVARIADPETNEDPLAYSTGVDPELRRLFGFGDPLPEPVISPVIQHVSEGDRGLLHLLDFLIPHQALFSASASAAEEPDAVAKLNSWVPVKSELTAYLEMVRALLVELREEILATHPLSNPYAQVYRDLVLATAWQESCWRQFIRQGDAIIPLVSSANSVGLMQVNPRVWRGIYDVEGLHGDIRYNGRAGCEILLHYLRDYAMAKGEDKLGGGVDNLPRATYAIYNGGPGQRSRYRSTTTSAALKKIDASLWEKYAAVREGREMEVAGCYK